MTKTVDITASYVGGDITLVDIYNSFPGGTLLSGSFTPLQMENGVRLTNIADSTFSFVLVDTATSSSSSPANLPGPTITDFTPTTAGQEDTINITGTGLVGTTLVRIGDVSATFTVNTNTSLDATVPLNATGSNTVSVTTPRGTANKVGWSYDDGIGPTVFNVTSDGTNTGFTYDGRPTVACSEQNIKLNLFSTAGSSIEAVFSATGQVFTDEQLTQLAPTGYYSSPSINFAYFVNNQGSVVEKETCGSSVDEPPLPPPTF